MLFVDMLGVLTVFPVPEALETAFAGALMVWLLVGAGDRLLAGVLGVLGFNQE